MEDLEFQSAPVERPRTITVIGVLVVTAATLSYLGAYAMANALVSADLIKAWPKDHDPRFKWFLVGFVMLITLFGGIGAMFRFFSKRHLKKIDEMDQADV
jgi:hypothetical protein